ncbi:glycosyltransferase [Bosea sp. Tri-44]|uniref:glycosyltransferase n=1 Tax=Bosea sp. Tri-44 TaxID=1972137 RepID=UPI0013E9891E|nr:glycosyltransferase [Bosea sp. Tri-44]
MNRLAIVTTAAPPSASGQARVLGLLLAQERDDPCHVFLSDQLQALDSSEGKFGLYVPLSAPRFQMMRTLRNKHFQRLNNYAGLVRDVLTRANEIVGAVKEHPVQVIVGCSGNPFDLPAAAIAAKRLQLPFVAYLFDDPVYQWEKGAYRSLARFWEKRWAARAAKVIVPNEVLAEDVRARVPSASIAIVRNPADLAQIAPRDLAAGQTLRPRPPPTAQAPWTVLYTGSVYSAQASAFQNLIAALDRTGGRFHLHVHTAQSETQVRDNGLVGPFVRRFDHLPQAQALTRQREADILFLPLAFESPIPEVVRSSAPAKIAEYLASGRPIIVHAPRGSFVSSFFTAREAGLVVDQPDVDALAQALTRLSENATLQANLVANARAAAKEFGVDRARAAFSAVLAEVG